MNSNQPKEEIQVENQTGEPELIVQVKKERVVDFSVSQSKEENKDYVDSEDPPSPPPPVPQKARGFRRQQTQGKNLIDQMENEFAKSKQKENENQSDSDDDSKQQGEQMTSQNKNQHIQQEIIDMKQSIDQKRKFQRKSTFQVANVHVEESGDESEDNKVKTERNESEEENEATTQENQIDHLNELTQQQQSSSNAQTEIKQLFTAIQDKKSLKRQSTFSHVIQRSKSSSSEEDDEQDQDTVALELPQKPNVTAYEEIQKYVSAIEGKKNIKRQSTFAHVRAISESESEDGDEEKDAVQQMQQNASAERSDNKEQNSDDNDTLKSSVLPIRPAGPSVLEEISKMVGQIQQKSVTRRQSTFSQSQPVLIFGHSDGHGHEKDDTPRSDHKGLVDSIAEEIDELEKIVGDLKEPNGQRDQIKLEENQDMDVDRKKEQELLESQAAFMRQKKKRDIMDYKKEEVEQEGEPEQKRKMIFFNDSQNKRNMKVIHPVHKHETHTKQQHVDEQQQQKQQDVNDAVGVSDEAEIAAALILLPIDEQENEENIQPKTQQKEVELNQSKGDTVTAQWKLESLLERNGRGKNTTISTIKNSFAEQQPVLDQKRLRIMAENDEKLHRIQVAKKKKRELESMLASINAQIKNLRYTDLNDDENFEKLEAQPQFLPPIQITESRQVHLLGKQLQRQQLHYQQQQHQQLQHLSVPLSPIIKSAKPRHKPFTINQSLKNLFEESSINKEKGVSLTSNRYSQKLLGVKAKDPSVSRMIGKVYGGGEIGGQHRLENHFSGGESKPSLHMKAQQPKLLPKLEPVVREVSMSLKQNMQHQEAAGSNSHIKTWSLKKKRI